MGERCFGMRDLGKQRGEIERCVQSELCPELGPGRSEAGNVGTSAP